MSISILMSTYTRKSMCLTQLIWILRIEVILKKTQTFNSSKIATNLAKYRLIQKMKITKLLIIKDLLVRTENNTRITISLVDVKSPPIFRHSHFCPHSRDWLTTAVLYIRLCNNLALVRSFHLNYRPSH